MLKNLLIRYQFSSKARSHKHIFLYRPPKRHFHCKNVPQKQKRDSETTVFLYRPRRWPILEKYLPAHYLHTKKPGTATLSPLQSLCNLIHLCCIQLIIITFLCHKFIMTSTLYDTALIHIHNLVTVFDSRKSVGNDEGGSALKHCV